GSARRGAPSCCGRRRAHASARRWQRRARIPGMDECVQVTTTTATDSDARALAQGLVEARLAACVQVVGPITSVYRWEGEVQVDDEWLCLAKTTRARLSELT